MDELKEALLESKEKGILGHRFTKKNTTGRDFNYYVSLEYENINVRYGMGRLSSDLIDKLGYLEDILEDISLSQLQALRKTVRK